MAGTFATFHLWIDWNNNSIDDGGIEDVTADVQEIDWRRGRNYPSQLVGRFASLQAQIILNNEAGAYSSFGTTDIKTGRRARLEATDATGKVILWSGYVSKVVPHSNANRMNVADVTVVGPLAFVNRKEVTVAMETNISSGVAVERILDAVPFGDYPTVILADSPVAYWRLGESSGTFADSSVNSNTGTGTSITYSSTSLLKTTNTSIGFDGADSKIECGSDSSLDDIFAGGGSAEAWINAASDGEANSGRIADKGWKFLVQGESAGAMFLGFIVVFSSTNGEWRTTSRDIEVNVTHHVGVTYNSNNVGNDPILYIDGVAVAITEITTPVGTATADAGNNLFIGNEAGSVRTFDGKIDEPAIYTTILTATKFAQHYFAGISRQIDSGLTTFTRWWTDEQLTLQALRDIEASELGFLWETRDGRIAFADRNGRLDTTHQTSQSTFSDAGGSSLSFSDITQEDADTFIYNIVKTPVQLFTVGSEATLWTYSEQGTGDALVEPGVTRVFEAEYPVADSPTADVGVDVWSALVASAEYTMHTQVSGGGSDITGDFAVTVGKFGGRQLISVKNNGAVDGFITTLSADGTPVTKTDILTITRKATSTELIEFGERTYPITPLFIPTSLEAQDRGDFVVSISKGPIPLPAIEFWANNNATHMSAALRLEIGDRITIDANTTRSDLGMDNVDVFIEAEQVRITKGKAHNVILQCSEAAKFSDFWVWGTAKWGTTTRWSY